MFHFNEWSFDCRFDTPISSSNELSVISSHFSFPLPGIIFGNNFLHIKHSSSFSLSFLITDCLKGIPLTQSKYTVKAAKTWKPAAGISASSNADYDWSYFSQYEGTLCNSFEIVDSKEGIDLELLRKKDPFLMYRSFLLFEDELADCGNVSYSVKVRVMPTFWFVLAESQCRIDFVCEERREIRYFHLFGTDCVVKSVKEFKNGSCSENEYKIMLF